MRTTVLLGSIVALSSVQACTSPEPAMEPTPMTAPEEPRSDPSLSDAINTTCPRSGKPVSSDSLTEYRGRTVGFCNPHCRDDFAANVSERPTDRAFFDAILDDA